MRIRQERKSKNTIISHNNHNIKQVYKTKNHQNSQMKLTANCLGRLSATLSNNVRVGLSPQRTTSCTLASPRSRRPLARMPTLITPFNMRGGPSSFFSLCSKQLCKSSSNFVLLYFRINYVIITIILKL